MPEIVDTINCLDDLPKFIKFQKSKKDKHELLGADRFYVLFQHYFSLVYRIAVSMFKWDINDTNLNMFVLEQDLINTGVAVIFKEPALDRLICAKAVGQGNLDVYGDYTEYQAITRNGLVYNGLVPGENCAVIFNNKLHTPLIQCVSTYAGDLAQAHHLIEVNTNQQKFTSVFTCTKETKKTLQDAYSMMQSGVPGIAIDSAVGQQLAQTQLFQPQSPYIADKLYTQIRSWWSLFLTNLGVDTVPFEKNERMNSSESSTNDEQVLINRDFMLEPRIVGAQQLKNVFGVDAMPHYSADTIDFALKFIHSQAHDETIELAKEAGGNIGNI